MSSLSRIQRLALLVAFLPQLLLLGIGSGTVVCVDQSGNLHVEVGANACCAEFAPETAGAHDDTEEDSDCGSCADYEVVLEPLSSPGRSASQLELPPIAPLALPIEFPAIQIASASDVGLRRSLDRGFAPPHLIQLRSVLLRV